MPEQQQSFQPARFRVSLPHPGGKRSDAKLLYSGLHPCGLRFVDGVAFTSDVAVADFAAAQKGWRVDVAKNT